METTDIDCIVSRWNLIEIHDVTIHGVILWGIVDIDHKRRFIEGDYVSTSYVKEVNHPIVKTLNSVYKLEGEGKHFVMYAGATSHLRAGYSPDEILNFNSDLGYIKK